MVGDSNFSTAGLNSLNVVSLGNRGIATGAAGLMSKIHGDLESLKVQNDIRTASITVDGDLLAGTIGGSVEGSLFPNSGRIYTTGDIQALKIDGQLRGGTGQDIRSDRGTGADRIRGSRLYRRWIGSA